LHFSTKEVFPRNPAEDFCKKEPRQFIARATQRVFPLFQPAIPQSPQELPWQPDWSLHSLQARWWELELSQESQFRFFARTPREARHRPECKYISS
jgi:hypothetical protein